MKKIIPLLLIAVAIISCDSKTNKNNKQSIENADVTDLVTVIINIDGMTCNGCENAIIKSITSLDGVQKAEASYSEGIAKVTFDTTSTSIKSISEAITQTGYETTGYKME